MDQESFRKLLESSGGSSNGTPRASTATSVVKKTKAKTKKSQPSEPAFKPRTVKQAEEKYRDRATERRLGIAHDYAQIEALAEDFERRNADQDRATIEEQRRYLGGDSEHTVLVKGLDFALLEQNKARATAATEDDDALEQVFQEASSSLPKKRTREEIVNELKSKRLKSTGTPEGDVLKVVDAPLEEAKKAGKFKPIGFKPIGSADGAKKKKKVKVKAKAKEDAAGVKKKVTTKPVAKSEDGKAPAPSEPATVASTSKNVPSALPAPEPEPLDDEFDIFAGAGEYTGVDLGDDEESEGEISETEDKRVRTSATPDAEAPPSRHWFETEEEKAQRPPASPPSSKSPPPEPIPEEREEGEEEEEAPARLAPLASSSIPSIRDFLAMDAEAEKVEKRRAKKEKKKKGLP